MAKWGKCNFKELKQLSDKMQEQTNDKVEQFCEDITKELATRLLEKMIKRTPVGAYGDSTSNGETLRQGWATKNSNSGIDVKNTNAIAQYVDTLKIHHDGDKYRIELNNPVEYASEVEYGYKSKNNDGWVKGSFMMTISEKELQQQSASIIQMKLQEYLKEVFK